MSGEVRVVGDYGELQEQPGSPDYAFGDMMTCDRTFEGPFEACLAAAPGRGATMVDTGSLVVVTSRVVRLEAGHGRLTVKLESTGFTSSGGDGSDVTYEIDWIEIEKPVETNPRYRPGGDSELTEADRFHLQAWKNEPDVAKKKIFAFELDGGLFSLEGNPREVAEKIIQGRETYQAYYPVARINSLWSAIPSVEPCGVYSTSKPFTACPAGYTWVKTADRPLRSGRSGRWTRNVEWTGFVDIDTDLYTGAGGGS